MAHIKAKEITVSLYVQKDCAAADGSYDLSCLTADEQSAYDALQAAGVIVGKKYGNSFSNIATLYFKPLENDGDAVATVEKFGGGKLPFVYIGAKYADDSTASFYLSPTALDILTGLKWDARKIVPYIESLATQNETQPTETSLVCKIPVIGGILCGLPVWVLLAGAAYTTKEAITANNTRGQYINGGLALLAWNAFFGAGGFSAIMPPTSGDTTPPKQITR